MGCQSPFISAENYQLASSTTRPTGSQLYTGLRIFEGDTGRELLYDGTGWVIQSEPINTFNTFTVTSQTGTITTVGSKFGEYSRSNGYVTFTFSAGITTNGTGATWINLGLPVAARSNAVAYYGFGRDATLTGKALEIVVAPAAAVAILGFTDGSYPAGSGATLQGTVVYPMTTRYS